MANVIRKWFEARDAMLREKYPGCEDFDKLIQELNRLPGEKVNSKREIVRRASEIHVYRKGENLWTKDRLEFLHENKDQDNLFLMDGLNKLAGRKFTNFRQINGKKWDLQIVRSKRTNYSWTDARLDYLRKNYPENISLDKMLEDINDMPGTKISGTDAIQVRARQMNLLRNRKFTRVKCWTSERLKEFEKLWTDSSRNRLTVGAIRVVLNKMEGHPIGGDSILPKQAHRMGITRPKFDRVSKPATVAAGRKSRADPMVAERRREKAEREAMYARMRAAQEAAQRRGSVASPVADDGPRAAPPPAVPSQPQTAPEPPRSGYEVNYGKKFNVAFKPFPNQAPTLVTNDQLVEEAMKNRYDKVRQYLRDRKEPFAISNWTKVPLREVIRIQREMINAKKSA